MALHNLIARSGAENFETMRRGWLPTTEERQKEEMRGLQIQSTKSELDYTPTRRKMAEEAANLDNDYKQSLMQKYKDDSARFKSEADAKKYALNQKNLGRHLTTASKQKTREQKRRYLQDYKSEFLDYGSDKEDKAFNSVVELKGSEFDRGFDMMLQGNKFIQELNEKRFGQYTSLQNYKTNETDDVSLNDPDYEAKMADLTENKGFTVIKTPGLEMKGTANELGLTGTQAGKTVKEHVEERVVAENSIKGMDQIINFVKSDDFVGGAAGDLVSGLNSIAKQARQLFGYSSILNKDGSLDLSKVKPDPNVMSRFQRMAIQDSRTASALMEMAYLKAKSLDRGGRVTDADFKFAMDMLAAGADKAVIITLLEDNIGRIESKFNTKASIYNEEYGNGKSIYSSINANKVRGISNIQNLSSGQKLKAYKDELADINAQLEGQN